MWTKGTGYSRDSKHNKEPKGITNLFMTVASVPFTDTVNTHEILNTCMNELLT